MNNLFLIIIGYCGIWFMADGIASLWVYLPKKERWWRNHSLRVLRIIGGLIVAILSAIIGG